MNKASLNGNWPDPKQVQGIALLNVMSTLVSDINELQGAKGQAEDPVCTFFAASPDYWLDTADNKKLAKSFLSFSSDGRWRYIMWPAS